ncbi:MAG: hypothetical protein NWE93_04310 [Candidatus Bathyarchaeota archaeon]|nr:hypothetical protein [Candidatus Bathyarchaeota archaeon]
MKKTSVLAFILIAVILAASGTMLLAQNGNGEKAPSVYVGVAYGGETVEAAKLIIDRTKSYTNLFILNSGLNAISSNETAVREICDYATEAGLSIIVNLGTREPQVWAWKLEFYRSAGEIYGDKFLGAYYDDEVGGIPLDWDWPTYFTTNSSLFQGASPLDLTEIHYRMQMTELTGVEPANYTLEAQWVVDDLLGRNRGHNSLIENSIPTFTSDYALYWFDYLGKYDVLLAQIGWNQSINLHISQIRGAATMQNRDWGAIITWKYMQPPYLDSGQNIYNQMKTAYNAGAKYIAIFDYPYNDTANPYGIMKTEHFQALQTFWTQVATKYPPSLPHAEAALVLPKDYGWGMRSVDDKIWGFYGPDSKSPLIWSSLQKLQTRYGLALDIIYDDPKYPTMGNYSAVYSWNQTS